MVSIAELQSIADAVLQSAVLARQSEIVASTDDLETSIEIFTPEGIAEITREFDWIPDRLAEFSGIDTGANDPLSSIFDNLYTQSFHGHVPVVDQEPPTGIPIYPLAEFHELAGIITEESHGASFAAFETNFLDKFSGYWENQALLARCLADTALLAAKIYEQTREDLAVLAGEAIESFGIVYALNTGDDGFLSGMGEELGIIGLGATIVGFIPGANIAAGLVSLGVGVASLLQEDATGILWRPNSVSGRTAAEVAQAFRAEIYELEKAMRDAEDNLIAVLRGFNEGIEKREQQEALFVAPDMSFPR